MLVSRRCLDLNLDYCTLTQICTEWLDCVLMLRVRLWMSCLCSCLCVCTWELWARGQAASFRPSVRASGIPPWSWGLPGRPPAWYWSLCGCSSSGRRASPYTCGCKHKTVRHAQWDKCNQPQQWTVSTLRPNMFDSQEHRRGLTKPRWPRRRPGAAESSIFPTQSVWSDALGLEGGDTLCWALR